MTLMLHQRLKNETGRAHQALEKRLVTVIRSIKTIHDYGELLLLMYGFYSPLEKQVERWIPEEAGLNISVRRKAYSIRNDLKRLQYRAEPAICDQLPDIQNFHRALGSLYVMEGSTLGGAVIAQLIRNRLALPEAGLSFFLAYGENTLKMWEDFKLYLMKPFSQAEESDIIVAAEETFIAFENWIEKYAR